MYSNIYNIYSIIHAYLILGVKIYIMLHPSQNIILKTESSPADQSVGESPMYLNCS